MATKTKAFDCVDMKNRIQDERMAQYQAAKGQYASFEDFITARAQKSDWVRHIRRKLRLQPGR